MTDNQHAITNEEDAAGHDAAQSVRALLVDDSLLIQRLISTRLAADRITVTTIASGAAALDHTLTLRPEVVLLDLELPDADGFDVLVALKANHETHDIPVIVMSASGDTSRKVRAFEAGAIDYITKPFDTAEVRARVGSAVRMYRMIVMLAQRAQIDGLTGLYNRAYFDTRLQQEIAEAHRFGTRLSLILCDLDHFKTINDTFGHPFGDRVLETFARVLLGGRMSDTACRYGGEEFAVILPRAACAEAAGVADRFRHMIAAATWENVPDLRITASFGVADLDTAPGRHTADLVRAADRALYRAKQSGRNCVCTAAATDVDVDQMVRRTA